MTRRLAHRISASAMARTVSGACGDSNWRATTRFVLPISVEALPELFEISGSSLHPNSG
jgi:hypothetical protein